MSLGILHPSLITELIAVAGLSTLGPLNRKAIEKIMEVDSGGDRGAIGLLGGDRGGAGSSS